MPAPARLREKVIGSSVAIPVVERVVVSLQSAHRLPAGGVMTESLAAVISGACA